MEIPAGYKGREQAFVKHTLLKTYLERLFMIVGQTQKTICYVDCFAGPWQEDGNDLHDTSIAISLEIMQKCRDGLHKFGKPVRFRALYIEKEEGPFNRLEAFLSENEASSQIETKAMKGEFFNLRTDILNWCGKKDFGFFFIDPKGWKRAVEIPTLKPLLQRTNSEYVINFMYDFLLRTHTWKVVEDEMREIFGEVPNTHDMTPEQKESCLLSMYQESLKKAQPDTGPKTRSVHVKVLYPDKDRTLYALVYLTRHPKGIVEFMEASEQLEWLQRAVRLQAKQDRRVSKTFQGEMFSADVGLEGKGERIDLSAIKDYWLSKLSSTPRRFGIIELADIIEETGWLVGDLQKAFGELLNERKVVNHDSKGKRRVKFVHFEEKKGTGELLERKV
jgi:three-Cys-motif partner protein